MHEYTVELRISSPELVPSSVTETLGLEPSLTREVGERRSENSVWEEALWAYNGSSAAESLCWSSLEEGLTFVLNRLEPLQSLIDTYKQKHDLVWWCGHFQSSFDGGPTFSAKLMRRLADFGVELFVDNYFTDPWEDPA